MIPLHESRARIGRGRLLALMALPLAAVAILGSMTWSSLRSTATPISSAQSLASVLPDAFRLAHQVQVEFEATLVHMDASRLGKLRMTTDREISQFQASLAGAHGEDNTSFAVDVRVLAERLGAINTTRKELAAGSSDGIAGYGDLVVAITRLGADLGAMGEQSFANQTQALDHAAEAAEALVAERSVLAGLKVGTAPSQAQVIEAAVARASWVSADTAFRDLTTDGVRLKAGAPSTATLPDTFTTVPSAEDISALVSTWTTQFASMMSLYASAADELAGDLAAASSTLRVETEVVAAGTLGTLGVAGFGTFLAVRRPRRRRISETYAPAPGEEHQADDLLDSFLFHSRGIVPAPRMPRPRDVAIAAETVVEVSTESTVEVSTESTAVAEEPVAEAPTAGAIDVVGEPEAAEAVTVVEEPMVATLGAWISQRFAGPIEDAPVADEVATVEAATDMDTDIDGEADTAELAPVLPIGLVAVPMPRQDSVEASPEVTFDEGPEQELIAVADLGSDEACPSEDDSPIFAALQQRWAPESRAHREPA